MKLFVPRESDPDETRIAASPDTVKKMIDLGFSVFVEKGAGELSRIPDEKFEAAGARLGGAKDGHNADVVLKVRRPTRDEVSGYRKDALVIASIDPYGHEDELKAIAEAGVCAFAMELMPRITRAQSMDVLSSQANLAGYKAVIDAAEVFDRALPMMMTAAGTVPAARVFVMGAGVAGLQAVATARRLGAIVTATDVRAAAGEQVESLGAKFIMTEALKDASGEGGYARELTDDEKKAQAELVSAHIAKQDIVIATALIPGKPAPKLVSSEMLASMAPGSVLVDLAVERGGNIEGSKSGEVVRIGEVSVVGYLNVPGRIAATASLLYAKNLLAFLETMVDKENSKLSVDWDDELVKATLLTRSGRIVHPAFSGAAGDDKTGSKPKKRARNTAKSRAAGAAGAKQAAADAGAKSEMEPENKPAGSARGDAS